MTAALATILKRFHTEAVRGEVATPRYRMRYVRWGSGPPLVIVHGLNDVPQSFAPVMAHLQQSFQCFAITLPDGHRDGADLHRYRHEDYSSDVIALLDHLGLERANLLGSSFGSTITLRTAATFPQRLDRVILQGGFAHRPLNLTERFLSQLGRSWPWRMGQLPLRPRIMRRLEAPAFVRAPEMLDFLLANSGETPIRATTHRARMLPTLDLRPLLPTIPHSVLMLGGDRDALVPRSCEAEVEAGVKQVERQEFELCGHYPQYTHAGEMAKRIAAFLTP